MAQLTTGTQEFMGNTDLTEEDIWKTIDLYFKSYQNYLTLPQLDSYNTFVTTQIPKTVRQFNPIELVSSGKMSYRGREVSYQQNIAVTIGGSTSGEEGNLSVVNDGAGVVMGRPVIEEKDAQGNIYTKQLFPNEARLRNLNYCSMLYANVQVELSKTILDSNETIPTLEYLQQEDTEVETGGTSELGVRQEIHVNSHSIIKTFYQVPLGRIPIMLRSKICSLYNQSGASLRAMGECPYGQGGYFVIKGKEKVIVAQERQMENKVFVHRDKTLDSPFSWSAEVRSSPEHVFQPARVTKLLYLRKKTLKAPNNQNRYLFDLYQKTATFLSLGDKVSFSTKLNSTVVAIDQDTVTLHLEDGSDVTEPIDNLSTRGKLTIGKKVIYRKDIQEGIIRKRFGTGLVQVEVEDQEGGESFFATKIPSELSLVSRRKEVDKRPLDPELWCPKKEKGKKKKQEIGIDEKNGITIEEGTFQVVVPNIAKPVPLLILFRALGIESDLDIMRFVVRDLSSSNQLSEKFVDMLKPSIR